MTEVEKIALWIGLISSIVSIVLSVVAIVFAILVDRGARAVSAQTIKSLQKIESDVAQLSSDTSGLIKAAWDKMLGSVSSPSSDSDPVSAKEIASGLLSEMRANLDLGSAGEEHDVESAPEHQDKLNELFKYLETSLEAQIRTQSRSERPSEALEHVMSLLNSLTPLARTLAYQLATRGHHLDLKQFQALSKESAVSGAVSELRDSGLLIPLSGVTMDKERIKQPPVYYFPSSLSQTLRAALLLLSEPPKELAQTVIAELSKVGYYSDIGL